MRCRQKSQCNARPRRTVLISQHCFRPQCGHSMSTGIGSSCASMLKLEARLIAPPTLSSARGYPWSSSAPSVATIVSTGEMDGDRVCLRPSEILSLPRGPPCGINSAPSCSQILRMASPRRDLFAGVMSLSADMPKNNHAGSVRGFLGSGPRRKRSTALRVTVGEINFSSRAFFHCSSLSWVKVCRIVNSGGRSD